MVLDRTRVVGAIGGLLVLAAVLLAWSGWHHAHSTSAGPNSPATTLGTPREPVLVFLQSGKYSSSNGSSKVHDDLVATYGVHGRPITQLLASYAVVDDGWMNGISANNWEISLDAPGFTNASTKGQSFETVALGRRLDGMLTYGSGVNGPTVTFGGLPSKAVALTIARRWTTQVTVR